MQSYFKFRHDPKVAPTSMQGPEQIVILLRVGMNHGATRGDQRESFYVVRRESVKAGQHAESSTQNQSRSTGIKDKAYRKCETCFLRGSIILTHQATASDPPFSHSYVH